MDKEFVDRKAELGDAITVHRFAKVAIASVD